MTQRETRGSSGETTAFRGVLDDYLRDKGKGRDGKSGNYRSNAERQLENFVNWLEAEPDPVLTFDELDAKVLRRYARDELVDSDRKASTVHKYYDYVSAFVGWCQREGLVSEHYGIQRTAREPLPDTDGKTREQQQTWHQKERKQILRHVDRRAHEAIDDGPFEALTEIRNRALVYILAYTGVRGGEFLSVSEDERRGGATWRDLGDDYTTLEVLSKKQDINTRAIPEQARHSLKSWEDVLRPNDDWPIIPTFHLPSLYSELRGEVEDDVIDDVSGAIEVLHVMREEDISPPSMSTDGARNVMKRLTEAADIDVQGGDYLQLHGARRGVGRVLAMTAGADAAARQLDNSVKVVEESYSEVLAEEQAEATARAFEEHDST